MRPSIAWLAAACLLRSVAALNNPAVPGVMDFVGCVSIGGSGTAIAVAGGDATPEDCQSLCDGAGREYAALKGDLCYCNTPSYPEIQFTIHDVDLCDTPCSFEPASSCGSVDFTTFSLYRKVGGPTTTTTTTTTSTTAGSSVTRNPAVPGIMDFVGCAYIPDAPEHLQEYAPPDVVTPETCQLTCADTDHKFAALMGQGCYCESIPNDLIYELKPPEDCTDSCVDEPTSNCGNVEQVFFALYQRVATTTTITETSSSSLTATSTTSSDPSVRSNPAVPGVMEYVGCMIPTNISEENVFIAQYDDLVEPVSCQNTCAAREDRFAVLAQGTCACATGDNVAFRPAASEESCNMACPGNPNTKCGGEVQNQEAIGYSVYRRLSPAANTTTSDTPSTTSTTSDASSTTSGASSTTSAAPSTTTSLTPASSLPDPNPAVFGVMSYVGCVGLLTPRNSLELANEDNTVEPRECQRSCASKGREYAALQGNTCYCSAEGAVFDYAETPSPAQCDNLCPGDTTTLCGDVTSNAFSLYRRVPRNPELQGVMSYVGCVSVPAPEVDLQYVYIGLDLDPRKCQQVCADRCYQFAALQGSACACNSNNNLRYTVSGNDYTCNIDCPGNPGNICGGRQGFGETYWSLYKALADPVSPSCSNSASTSSTSLVTRTSIERLSTATDSSTVTGTSIPFSNATIGTTPTDIPSGTPTGSPTTTSIPSFISIPSGLSGILSSLPSGSPSILLESQILSGSSGTITATQGSGISAGQSSASASSRGSGSSGNASPATDFPAAASSGTQNTIAQGSNTQSSSPGTSASSGPAVPGASSASNSASPNSTPSGTTPSSSPGGTSQLGSTSSVGSTPSSATAGTSSATTPSTSVTSLTAFVNTPILFSIQAIGGGDVGGTPPEETGAAE